MRRRVWVRRPEASATLVQVDEDSLVDDLRELILDKYSNSLGRSLDAPDILLHITSRSLQGPGQQHEKKERVLCPDERICAVIDAYFPGGQTAQDALLVYVSQPSQTDRSIPAAGPYFDPQPANPLGPGADYFHQASSSLQLAMPHGTVRHGIRPGKQLYSPSVAARPTSHPLHNVATASTGTGQRPPLPSPNASRQPLEHRKEYLRQSSSSSIATKHTLLGGGPVDTGIGESVESQTARQSLHGPLPRNRRSSSATEHDEAAESANAMATTGSTSQARETITSNASGSSPPCPPSIEAFVDRQTAASSMKRQKSRLGPREKVSHLNGDAKGALRLNNLLDGSIPAISVLIVEDNMISLRVLEGRMKTLRVRWQTATNGQIAVEKWKAGGTHLILMDIQMPVMDGLEATKEIRRLEKANGIGIHAGSPSARVSQQTNDSASDDGNVSNTAQDSLAGPRHSFKSPVIIVALTASSLQSDRHEALAAGCNDFLTKPVDFHWLEKKVKEWGCMQALVDYDGWQAWKALG